MGHAATLFVYYVSIFRGFRKFILGVIKKWSSEAALTPPILSGGKKSRPTPAYKLLHRVFLYIIWFQNL